MAYSMITVMYSWTVVLICLGFQHYREVQRPLHPYQYNGSTGSDYSPPVNPLGAAALDKRGAGISPATRRYNARTPTEKLLSTTLKPTHTLRVVLIKNYANHKPMKAYLHFQKHSMITGGLINADVKLLVLSERQNSTLYTHSG